MSFSWQSRVYFGDTDAAGIVYHGRYVYWMEAARIEWLLAMGCPYSGFVEQNIALIPVNLTLDFKSPMMFEDMFTVKLSLTQVKRASFCIGYTFFCGETLKALGSVTLACLNASTFKPIEIPDNFRGHLAAAMLPAPH